ncbi:MAG: glycosyltransferase family 1 protein [Eubacterium sp.]|jgi:rhamnosyltransferase|nr:glycosyltransferase family 1 protein [Eubacterium sp.]
MRDIFIIGSKGIPAAYGGFETFVEQLTRHKKDRKLRYHVACIAGNRDEFEYQGAHCFVIRVPGIGPAKAVWYDMAAAFYCLRYIRAHRLKNPVVYVLACRIGPFTGFLKKKLKKLGATLLVNPDGHEWMRAKWSKPIRAYWKFSERLMVKHADLLVCDSKNMERYIRTCYRAYKPKTVFIAYGADVGASSLSDTDERLLAWYRKWGLAPGDYFLIVGRFVPENNYETMLLEFIRAKTGKKLAIISNVEENAFYKRLKERTGFDVDPRIVFCQTVYDERLLKKIRENACAYLHGHEVGGTNPSLLEALGSTDVNLLLDVGFNREVGMTAALYWTKRSGSLAALIEKVSAYSKEERAGLGSQAKQRILTAYSYEKIAGAYEELFRGI